MLNIKSLLLGNFRIFSESSTIKLAPVTILTGPNRSGKSSIIRSLSLMKDLDTGRLPYRLRLDSGRNTFGSFDMITNKKSKNKPITVGYNLYNIILGADVTVTFTFERDGDFDAIARNVTVKNESGIIFDFQFRKDKIVSHMGVSYLFDKLMDIKRSKSRFTEIEKKIRDIKWSSGSYKDKPESENDLRSDNGNVRIFRVDKDLKKKNILDYLGQENVSMAECQRLFYFFGNKMNFPDDEKTEGDYTSRIKKIVSDFDEMDILFNNKLLKRINEIPKEDLNEPCLKSVIRDEFPDLFDCLLLLNNPESLSQIIHFLKMKDYKAWEKEFIGNDMISTQRLMTSEVNREMARAIEHHLQAMLGESPFFRTITELSASREGFMQVFSQYTNVKALGQFCSLVLEKIISDIETDIERSYQVPLHNSNQGMTIDFNHPLHDLIKRYSALKGEDGFLKKWFKKFNICDDLSIETPGKGIGYIAGLRRNKENFSLPGEGTGTNHLLLMLLSIANARQSSDQRDFNGESGNYPGTIILETPETGLHSEWQAKLAEMIIDANRQFGLHFIIETHSERIINKLQCMVAGGQIFNRDIIIYYVDNSCNGASVLKEILIGDDGSLSHELWKVLINEDDAKAMELLKLKKINLN